MSHESETFAPDHPISRGLHGHIDFLGTGAVSLKEEVSVPLVIRRF